MPAANTTPALPRGVRLGLAALGTAVLAAYANSLSAPFVYDDLLAIPENPSIRQLWRLDQVLWPDVPGGLTVSGRPVLNLSFALNYAVSGGAAWSYHVFNVLIHLAAALLLFGVVRRTLARPFQSTDARTLPAAAAAEWRRTLPPADAAGIGLAVAALWALHPLQTQAVTYTVQRAESLMGFCYLLTLYAFVRSVGDLPRREVSARRAHASGRREVEFERAAMVPPEVGGKAARRWAVASIAACALGVGTKEVMATAPLVVLLYDRTFVAGTFRGALRQRRGFYVALFATWLLLVGLLASTGGNRGGTVGLGTGLPLWAYPLTQFKALAHYLGLSGWPHPLIFEYGTFWVKAGAEVWPYALVVLPLLAAAIVALWRWPGAGFLGATFFLILAPTSLAPGTIQMIVEHRMYLPLAAVVTAGITALWRVTGARSGLALCGAAAALAVGTAARNHDYRSALALWSDTVAKRPLNPRAHEGLAEALAAAGRVDEAIKVREESVRLLPDESQYHYNLALTLAAAGRNEEAVRHYQQSLRLFPQEARTHNNLAILLAKLGRSAEALPHYAEAVRLQPQEALYHFNYGVALLREGQTVGAAASFAAAVQRRGDHADAHFNLAAALVRLGRTNEALRHFEHAVAVKPHDADYTVGLAGALLVTGRPAEALEKLRLVLVRDPNAVEARYAAGNALAALRRLDEAMAEYKAVLRASPDHAHAHFKLGNALLDIGRVPEAIPHYEAAATLSPGDAEAHHNLGIAFARLERWDDARRAFEEALRLRPDYADARRSREQLRQVTGR